MDSHVIGLQDIVAGFESAIGGSSFQTIGGLPNPGTTISGKGEVTGGTFTTSGGIHEALGGELRSIHGNLDTFGSLDIGGGVEGSSLESANIKRTGKVAESMNNKLAKVQDSIHEKVENIITLQNVLNTAFENLLTIVKNSNDDVSIADASNIQYVQDKLLDHLNKEVGELQTVLKTHIKPTKETILEILKKNKSFAALADQLGVSYDTDDGSDRLALAFTNLTNVGLAAKKVRAALDALKITVNDYEKINNIKKLEGQLLKVLNNNQKGKGKGDIELEKILDAIKVLQNNQYKHTDVINCLKDERKCTKLGKGEESSGAADGGSDVLGSAPVNNTIGRVTKSNTKSSLTKSIKTYQNTLKELFKNFMSHIHTNFKEIRTAVDEVADQIGGNIPYDEKISNFVNIFEGLSTDMENPKLFYALIALDNSLQSKELKNRFTDNLNTLIASLADLKSHKYLGEIEKQLRLVKENIDIYSDTVSGVQSTEFKIREDKVDGKGVEGGDDFFWTNKILDQSIPLNVTNLIKETITKLKFYGNVSQLRSNLESTFKEYSGYKENYDKLLGKSIGTKINELTKEYTENIDRLNDKERGRGWLLEEYNKAASANDKIPRGLIETIYKLQFDARVGLYKTIEAIDLYLIDFTEQLSGNVEAVKDLNKMLQQTEIISKWFNNDSQKHLDNLVDMIQIETGESSGINLDSKPFVTGAEIKKVLETCKKSIDSVSMLKNIISMFVHIGDKFGNKTLSKDMYMSPSIIYKNLVKYVWVSAFTMGYGSAGGDTDTEINSSKKDKNGYEVEKGDRASFFNLKNILIKSPLDLLSQYENCMYTKYGYKSGKGIYGGVPPPTQFKMDLSVLKNTLGHLKRVKDRELPVNVKTAKTINTRAKWMKVGETYIQAKDAVEKVEADEIALKDAVKTVEATKIILKDKATIINTDDTIEKDEDDKIVLKKATAEVEAGLKKAIIAVKLAEDAVVDARASQQEERRERRDMAMEDTDMYLPPSAVYPADPTTVDGLINKHMFVNDDKYFVLMMKAITSKVLTVIGTSNIIKQPATISNMLHNPIRTIIGGAKDPEIIDDAFELYIRLPLLVEFYKNVFDNGNESYKKNKNELNDTETIAYIPDIGSIWSGLIQCIFDESKYIKNGLYSLDNMKRIILEVNNIYKSYRNVDKKKLVRTAVLDLIADVNKRYGVLKKGEINEFYQIKKKYIRNVNDVTDSSNVNFDILDEDNEYEDSGPSSKYVENSFSKSSTSNYNIVSNDINIVKDFHDKINKELQITNIKDLSKKSFSEKIKFYKNELASNNNSSSKLDLIIKAIDESSDINSHNDDVNMMFHELVAAPIKNLQAVRNIIYDFVATVVPPMANNTRSSFKSDYDDILKRIDTPTTESKSSYNKAVSDFNSSGNNRSISNKINLLETINRYFNDLNQLIDIRFISNNKFVLEYSKLQKVVETSIENIKYMISKFRSQIDSEIIKKHETCILDIEDKLLIKILNNDDNNNIAYFDICNMEFINNCIGEFLESTKEQKLQNDLYKVIMISDGVQLNSQKPLSDKKNSSALFKDVFAQYQGGNKRLWLTIDNLTSAGASPDNNFQHLESIFSTLDTPNDTKSRSLLSGFNTLVYQYLTVFYDSATKKIYNNLFNEFVNKSQSNAIFSNNGIPDILSDLGQTGTDTVPLDAIPGNFDYNTFVENDHVLCESLAYMLKTLVNRTSNVQLPTKNHLLANLSEVSPNVVEKYKVYLPIFIKLFETLINKSLLIKKALETSDVKFINDGGDDSILNTFTNPRYIHGDVKGDVQRLNGKLLQGQQQSYDHFNNTLNNIVEASRSLINDANVVLAEINHKQQFFEIKENFIKNFYNNTNKLPLMPMSLTTLLLNKNVYNNYKSLMPYENKPDNEFKFLYGINSIINNTDVNNGKSLDNNINSYIWLKEELKNYNNGCLSINKIEVNKVNEYLEVNNKLTCYLSATLFNNKFISTGKGAMIELSGDSECGVKTYYTEFKTSPFTQAISSVDSTSIDNNKRAIAQIVNSLSVTKFDINRNNARFLNILDLNIMPINVHALMREIPLINIYNYAFTYDNIIKKTMGCEFDVNDCTKKPKVNEINTVLLLDPYYMNYRLDTADIYTAITSDDDILGKGKYMSDMISNVVNKDTRMINSKFVRNLIFFTNLQRFITSKIKKEVERINTKVVSDIAVFNPQITTYSKDNKEYKDDEFDYLMLE